MVASGKLLVLPAGLESATNLSLPGWTNSPMLTRTNGDTLTTLAGTDGLMRVGVTNCPACPNVFYRLNMW